MSADAYTAQPYFDMELFLQTAEATRLDGAMLEECLDRWSVWCKQLKGGTVRADNTAVFALWLDESVEHEVDAAWQDSPSRGHMLNALAQTICMCAVHERIPEVEDAGCAPSPEPSAELAEALTKAGLPTVTGAALRLGRKYAVVTPEPFKGGCECCALRRTCPRSGVGGMAVKLPGYE